MMKVIDSTQAVALRPQYAVILYGEQSGRGASHAFATAHPLTAEKKGWRIGAGAPLRKDALSNALYALLGTGRPELLPTNVLSAGPGYLAWWCPPQRRAVFFDAGSALSARHGSVPQPGLVFVWTLRSVYVMALHTDKRPDANSMLYNTPYWNVWKGGNVCKGNAPFPERPSVDQIAATENAFFHSRNTHPNVGGRLVNYRGGSTALWCDLLDGKHKCFPLRALLPAKVTLSEFLQSCIGDPHGSA